MPPVFACVRLPFISFIALALLAGTVNARAETLRQTLEGRSLRIDVSRIERLEIQPSADLSGKVMVEATASVAADLQDLELSGGGTVRIIRRRLDCYGLVSDETKRCIGVQVAKQSIALMVKVPVGMPIEIAENASGDTVVGAVDGPLTACITRSGDFTAEKVRDPDISFSRSRNLKLGHAEGDGDISIGESGRVTIEDARLSSAKLEISNSGATFVNGGEIGFLKVQMTDSSDLRIKATVGDAFLDGKRVDSVLIAKATGKVMDRIITNGPTEIGQ